MKKLIKAYRRWRYKRLYRQLFFFYMSKFNYVWDAKYEADRAFGVLTGLFKEEFDDWYIHDFLS